MLKGQHAYITYECTKCARWHLSPAERSTPSKHCSNCGKEAYSSEEDAERRAAIIKAERDESDLSVYECSLGKGWHLTSSTQW